MCIITRPPYSGRPIKCPDNTSENSASVWIFGAYWPIPNRDLILTSRVILFTVVSSLLTEARLYEFSRHLEYYLWYTLANSPISFWNRLNPTFTMAGHFLWHPTSAIGTTIPPNTEIFWVGQFVKSSISFGVSRMPARDNIRSTSCSGSENLQLRKWLEMSF